MSMPKFGPTPTRTFFSYREDDTDAYAAYWDGSQWTTEHHADRRGWYTEPLDQWGYEFLLNHYGLGTQAARIPQAELVGRSPDALIAERRALERAKDLPKMEFREGIDY